MARKASKTPYQLRREELGLSREKAADLLETIPPERIERIESGKFTAHPDEILLMAEKYKAPQLCNAYCTEECEIGRRYVPRAEQKELSRIVLEMLASLNRLQGLKEQLIELTADEKIDRHEIGDFVAIQKELEDLAASVETLRLWVDQKVLLGEIDPETYRIHREQETD